jgi:hypothetical protein
MTRIKAFAIVWTVVLAVALFGIDLTGQTGAAKDEYVMPEPYSHDRRTWIDSSTDPVTVWYVDHNGYIVRIQPLE